MAKGKAKAKERFNIEDPRLGFLYLLKRCLELEFEISETAKHLVEPFNAEFVAIYSLSNATSIFMQSASPSTCCVMENREDVIRIPRGSALEGILRDSTRFSGFCTVTPHQGPELLKTLGLRWTPGLYVEAGSVPQFSVPKISPARPDTLGLIVIGWTEASRAEMDDDLRSLVIQYSCFVVTLLLNQFWLHRVISDLHELSGLPSTQTADKLLGEERYFEFAFFMRLLFRAAVDRRSVNLLSRALQTLTYSLQQRTWVSELSHQWALMSDTEWCSGIQLLAYIEYMLKNYNADLRSQLSMGSHNGSLVAAPIPLRQVGLSVPVAIQEPDYNSILDAHSGIDQSLFSAVEMKIRGIQSMARQLQEVVHDYGQQSSSTCISDITLSSLLDNLLQSSQDVKAE